LARRRLAQLAGPCVRRAPPDAPHELPDPRLGELRRTPEAAVGLVELRRERLERAEEDLVGDERRRTPEPVRLGERLADLARRGGDRAAPIRPRVGEGLEESREGGQAVTLDGGKVGAAIERLAVGGEEAGHWPAAVARH